MKKNLIILVNALLLCVSCAMISCSNDESIMLSEGTEKSIVILYENDVHCNISGYTKIAGLRDAINQSDTAYAAIVSSGDYLQGGLVGAYSHGLRCQASGLRGCMHTFGHGFRKICFLR